MEFYKEWELMDSLPNGWKFLKSAGTPLVGYEFASNGSPLRGGKIALVRTSKFNAGRNTEQPAEDESPKNQTRDNKRAEKSANIIIGPSQSKVVNELARNRFKEMLLKDILVDLTICEIEGWDKKEYIKELRSLLNGIKLNAKKQAGESNSPQLF